MDLNLSWLSVYSPSIAMGEQKQYSNLVPVSGLLKAEIFLSLIFQLCI